MKHILYHRYFAGCLAYFLAANAYVLILSCLADPEGGAGEFNWRTQLPGAAIFPLHLALVLMCTLQNPGGRGSWDMGNTLGIIAFALTFAGVFRGVRKWQQRGKA